MPFTNVLKIGLIRLPRFSSSARSRELSALETGRAAAFLLRCARGRGLLVVEGRGEVRGEGGQVLLGVLPPHEAVRQRALDLFKFYDDFS